MEQKLATGALCCRIGSALPMPRSRTRHRDTGRPPGNVCENLRHLPVLSAPSRSRAQGLGRQLAAFSAGCRETQGCVRSSSPVRAGCAARCERLCDEAGVDFRRLQILAPAQFADAPAEVQKRSRRIRRSGRRRKGTAQSRHGMGLRRTATGQRAWVEARVAGTRSCLCLPADLAGGAASVLLRGRGSASAGAPGRAGHAVEAPCAAALRARARGVSGNAPRQRQALIPLMLRLYRHMEATEVDSARAHCRTEWILSLGTARRRSGRTSTPLPHRG